jgi:transposase-like protein
MDKTKTTIRPSDNFSNSERIKIIEEYLSTNISKVDIWRKYTGYDHDHGGLLRWMRQLNYTDKPKYSILYPISSQITPSILQITSDISQITPEEFQKKIKELEIQLFDAQLKVEASNLVIDLAEKGLNISIRKKFNTK